MKSPNAVNCGSWGYWWDGALTQMKSTLFSLTHLPGLTAHPAEVQPETRILSLGV